MEMLQLQQANISLWPERKLLLLNIDSGGVQSRRIIDRMLAQEQEQEQNQVKIASQNTTGAAA
jgi:vanillate O-demethylase monooxygenase subunit